MHLSLSELRRFVRHPAPFLLFINVCCALLAIAQFSVTLTILDPVDFAVIGVLAAINGVILQTFDVRTVDLTTKLYSARSADARSLRSDDLVAGLTLQAGLGLAVVLVTILCALVIAPLFLDQPIRVWWVLSMAIASAARFVYTPLGTYLRLIGKFKVSGLINLGGAILALVVVVASLLASPNLDGYFIAIGVVNVLLLVISLGVADGIVRGALGHGLLRIAPSKALGEHMRWRRFLLANSLGSFSKVLARTDILIIVALAGETVAGIYRVARLAYEALFGLGDAVHQYYSPTIVAAVSAGDMSRFRALKRQLLIMGGLAAIGAVSGSILVLGPLADAYFPLHRASIVPIAIFAGLIGINIGIHGWLWPLLVVKGGVGKFSLLSLAGAVAQLGALFALGLAGSLSPAAAAATNWLPALMTYAPYVYRRRRH
jgi:O-antigen/teichoic acid export membrane protein